MRVSQFYNLGKSQPSLPFLDVDVSNDVKLFINPRAMRTLKSDFGQHCSRLISSYFNTVVDSIRNGNELVALDIMKQLREPN